MSEAGATPLFAPERWQRLRELFAELDALAPDARDAALELIARDDPELAAAARGLLAANTAASTTSFWRLDADASDDTAMPAEIGTFRLLHRLGAGGMGVVYLAERHGADFTQRVALKLLDRDAARTRHLAARERRILAALAHPNITAFVDAGVSDGRAWLAMEYVDGEPLLDYCEHRALDAGERVRLFDQVCAAVAHAHAQLVVHRDLKPMNVLVSRAGIAKLLDFGIAQVLDAGEEQAPATRVFTPEYAAPEQLRGDRVTTATDVYALGLLLYELVSGRRLPASTHARSREWSTAELAREAATAPASRDRSDATTRTAPRLLRGDLGRIIAHALEPEPARRYGSVALLREDLERWLEHRPLTLRRPGVAYALGRFVRRHRWGVAASALAVAALIGTTLAAVWQAHAREIEAQRALAQAHRATAMQTFLGDVLGQAHPNENGGQPITPLQLIGKGEALIGRFDGEPDLQADVLAQVGRLYIANSDYARAKPLLERALTLIDRPGAPADVLARVLSGAAEIAIGNSDYDRAVPHARRALALIEADAQADPRARAAAHVLMAQALDGKGDRQETERFLRTSLAADAHAIGDNEKSVAEQCVLLGWTLGELGRFADAEPFFLRSIAAYRALYGADGFDVGHAYNEFSLQQSKANRIDDAERSVREAVRIYRATVGPTHRNTLGAEASLLSLMERRGHIVEALPQRESLIARASAPGIATARQLAYHYQWLGYDYAQLGRYADAEAALHTSLDFGKAGGGTRDNVADNATLRELGVMYVSAGRYDEAESTLRGALASAQAQQPPDRGTARALNAALGDLARLRGHMDDALASLREASTFPATTSPTSAWRPIILAQRSEAELDAGDVATALATARSALDFARTAYPADDMRSGYALYALARAQLASGHAADAEMSLRMALGVRHPPHPASHPRVLEAQTDLVRALRAQGKRDEALALRRDVEARLGSSLYDTTLRARLRD